MSRKKKLGAVAIAVMAVMVLSALVTAPATSHATAYGVQYWGAFTVNIKGQSVGIPKGQLAHLIKGKGYYIEWDAANFGTYPNICDSSMRFTYGNGSQRIDGNVHWGCSPIGQWKYALNRNVPRGDACAELWAKNWRVRVARQCHYVYG